MKTKIKLFSLLGIILVGGCTPDLYNVEGEAEWIGRHDTCIVPMGSNRSDEQIMDDINWCLYIRSNTEVK